MEKKGVNTHVYDVPTQIPDLAPKNCGAHLFSNKTILLLSIRVPFTTSTRRSHSRQDMLETEVTKIDNTEL